MLLYTKEGLIVMKKDGNFKIKLFLVVALTIVTTAAITYGFFSPNRAQSGKNSVTSECFNVDLANESGSISIANAYPIDDEEGLLSTPYTFDITNTCNIDAQYYVVIDTKTGSFSDNYVKVSVNDGTPKLLNSTPNTIYIPEAGYTSSAILDIGELIKNNTKNFQIKLWLDKDTTYEQVANKSWEGRVRVVSTVAEIERQKDNG